MKKSTRAAVIESVVLSGGGFSWWLAAGVTPWAAYAPKGAASLAASYTDLSGNGRPVTAGTAPTWDATNGWIFNGSTQYLITTFTPSNDQTQSIFVQYTNAGTGANSILGSIGASARDLYIYPNYTANAFYGNGNVITAATQLTAGNQGVAGNKGYSNGADVGGTIGAWAGTTTNAVWIGCSNNDGSPLGYLACRIQALIIYDVTLTGAQAALIAAAMAAL